MHPEIYFLVDADNYDQKLQKIVKMISSEDKDLQKVGLDALDGVLVLKKNLFTGPAGTCNTSNTRCAHPAKKCNALNLALG